MTARYPIFQRTRSLDGVDLWEGIISPLPGTPDENLRVVSALYADETVVVLPGGELTAEGGRSSSLPGRVSSFTGALGHIKPQFRVVAGLVLPPPAHPCAYVISPEVSRNRYPDHPHLNHGDIPCVIYAPDDVWFWPRDGLAEYLDFLAIWLAKHAVYHLLRPFLPVPVAWPGWSASHAAEGVIAAPRGSQCPCGSGLPVEACCLPRIHAGHSVEMRGRPSLGTVKQIPMRADGRSTAH